MGLLATVVLPSVSGLAKDNFVNNFSIGTFGAGSAIDPDDYGAIVGAVANFYRQAPGNGVNSAVGEYLSNEVARTAGASLVKLYDITGKLGLEVDPETGKKKPIPHGSPVFESGFTMPAASAGTAYPSQVACVMTMEAEGRAAAAVEDYDGGPIRPKQRRTGRIFVGPLTSFAGTGTGPVRPSASFLADLAFCANRLEEAILAIDATYYLGVWSRADASILRLRGVSIDNSFDTQRRRKSTPTARTRTAVRVDLAA